MEGNGTAVITGRGIGMFGGFYNARWVGSRSTWWRRRMWRSVRRFGFRGWTLIGEAVEREAGLRMIGGQLREGKSVQVKPFFIRSILIKRM